MKISNCNCDTFDVQVLKDIPSTNTTVHNFVSSTAANVTRSVITIGGEYNHTFHSAASNGVTVGGNYTHTFASAKNNSLHRQSGKITVDVNIAPSSADLYDHTFVSALAGAVIGGGSYRHTFVSAETNGVIKANDYVMFDDFSLGFTCDLDKDVTPHTYPRPTDYASNQWLPVHNVATSTFDVGVLGFDMIPSTFLGTHTFSHAKKKGLKKQDGTITVNVGKSPAGNTYQHTFVSANAGALVQGGNYRHTFVSAASNCITVANDGTQLTPTDAYYEPTSGQLTLTVAGHSLGTDDSVVIASNSLTFTCAQDSNTTNHTYPRITDFADGMKLPVQNVKSWAWPTRSDLDYYRSRLVDPGYTGNETQNVKNQNSNH